VFTAALVVGLVVPVIPGSPSSTSVAIETVPDCGAPVARRFSSGTWKCTFVDHFSGTELDRSIWTPLTAADSPAVTHECRVDRPANVKVRDGTLRLIVRKLPEPMVCPSPWGAFMADYTAGGVSSRHGFSQTRGRFQIRARFPAARIRGLHSAIWMWPKELSYGRYSGEIDIAEFRTGKPSLVVPTLHYYDDGTAGRKSAWDCKVSQPENFHTYTLEWTKTAMLFMYDGKACLYHVWQPASPQVKPQPFDHPFFLLLNQSLGIGDNSYDGRVTLPAIMQVDYVKVWS
jgi:beta-glucanase (GH16 family)